jgi:tetratricopeptide (TPR) repeat protein
MTRLGALLMVDGRVEEAAGYLGHALEYGRTLPPAGRHYTLVEAAAALARCYVLEGLTGEAQELVEESAHVFDELGLVEGSGLVRAEIALGRAFLDEESPEEAEDLFRRALRRMERNSHPPVDPTVQDAEWFLCHALVRQGRQGEAQDLWDDTVRKCLESLGPLHPHTRAMQRRQEEIPDLR